MDDRTIIIIACSVAGGVLIVVVAVALACMFRRLRWKSGFSADEMAVDFSGAGHANRQQRTYPPNDRKAGAKSPRQKRADMPDKPVEAGAAAAGFSADQFIVDFSKAREEARPEAHYKYRPPSPTPSPNELRKKKEEEDKKKGQRPALRDFRFDPPSSEEQLLLRTPPRKHGAASGSASPGSNSSSPPSPMPVVAPAAVVRSPAPANMKPSPAPAHAPASSKAKKGGKSNAHQPLFAAHSVPAMSPLMSEDDMISMMLYRDTGNDEYE